MPQTFMLSSAQWGSDLSWGCHHPHHRRKAKFIGTYSTLEKVMKLWKFAPAGGLLVWHLTFAALKCSLLLKERHFPAPPGPGTALLSWEVMPFHHSIHPNPSWGYTSSAGTPSPLRPTQGSCLRAVSVQEQE